MVYQEENNDIENNIHLPQIPITNYASDVEQQEDFGNGLEWTEKDPGSSCGPFISQPGLLIEPPSRTPQGFSTFYSITLCGPCLLNRQTFMQDKGYNN